jgi:hypothetical protein
LLPLSPEAMPVASSSEAVAARLAAGLLVEVAPAEAGVLAAAACTPVPVSKAAEAALACQEPPAVAFSS